MRKELIVILIVAMFVSQIIGAVGVTNPEMMTYTNEKYGFSIDHPEDWTVKEDYGRAVIVLIGPVKEGFIISVNIVAEELPIKMTVEEYAAASEYVLKNITTSYHKDKEYSTTINGESSVLRIFTATYEKDAPEIKQHQAYFIRDTTAYIVSCTASPSTYDEANENYFEPMTQSFKFMEGVTPTPILSPSPTPEEGVPGFEVVFAIAGLLAVAYLLRRRK